MERNQQTLQYIHGTIHGYYILVNVKERDRDRDRLSERDKPKRKKIE